jgi:hypothetical protein
MRKTITLFIIILFIMIMFTGCRSTSSGSIPQDFPSLVPTPPLLLKPLFIDWEVINPSILSAGNISLAIHCLDLDDQRMLVYYTLNGAEGAKLFSSALTRFAVNGGRDGELLQAIPLGKLGVVEAGVLVFPPLPRRASQLFIQINDRSSAKTIFNSLIAQRTRPNNQDIPNRFFIWSRGPVEQAGERVLFRNGPSILHSPVPTTSSLQPAPTASPTTEMPSTRQPYIPTPGIPAPKGVSVNMDFHFQAENLADGSVQVINLQILSNGDLLVQNSGTWTVAARLPVAPTPTPTPTEPPYPYPQPLSGQTVRGNGYPAPTPAPYPYP